MDIVQIKRLKKYFGEGPRLVKALDGITLSMEKGKFTAVVGASGSGKTTLLNLIGGLYTPTEGTVIVNGIDLARLSEDQRTVFRRRNIGFVFQRYHLVPELTVEENILFPLALDNLRPDRDYFFRLTDMLGLDGRLKDYPYMLSGGAQQCAAIARAFITKPSIILADEPTGSFDIKTSQNISGMMKAVTENFRQTLILITHNQELSQLADRVIHIQNGRVVSS